MEIWYLLAAVAVVGIFVLAVSYRENIKGWIHEKTAPDPKIQGARHVLSVWECMAVDQLRTGLSSKLKFHGTAIRKLTINTSAFWSSVEWKNMSEEERRQGLEGHDFKECNVNLEAKLSNGEEVTCQCRVTSRHPDDYNVVLLNIRCKDSISQKYKVELRPKEEVRLHLAEDAPPPLIVVHRETANEKAEKAG